MKYIVTFINVMIANIYYILLIYLLFTAVQLICLYYEYNKRNLALFLGNKAILFLALLGAYVLKNIEMIAFIYIGGLVFWKKFIDSKYIEEEEKEISELLLEDFFFLIASGILSFYFV